MKKKIRVVKKARRNWTNFPIHAETVPQKDAMDFTDRVGPWSKYIKLACGNVGLFPIIRDSQ